MVLVDTMKYDWMDAEIVGTPPVLNSEAILKVVGIMVENPLEWPDFPISPYKRSYFDDCMVPLYECLFTRIGIQLTFSDFKVVVLKHFKVLLLSFIRGPRPTRGYSSRVPIINHGSLPLDSSLMCSNWSAPFGTTFTTKGSSVYIRTILGLALSLMIEVIFRGFFC